MNTQASPICRKPSVFGSDDLGGRTGQDGIHEKPSCQLLSPSVTLGNRAVLRFGLRSSVCGSVIGRQAGSALDKGGSQADQ